ncbi:hypothetical protein F5146DRAFT_929778 [Armillaria mellea]|nr:hypothetical protein F5146DRAFT_929778 [Armillaria mellea]
MDNLTCLPQPKVKKAQNIELSLDTVRNRLKGIEFHEVPLEHDIRDVVVDRLFMSKVYGGNSQETFPRVAKKFLDMHHMDDFMYLNLNMNPHAPQVPGAPGLFFDADDMVEPVDESLSKTKRVFSRIDSAQWEYMGQYTMSPVASLTMEEWNDQRNTVRLVWASKLSTSGWGVHCRVVVHLREQLGRRPTKREVEEALQGENKYWNVTKEHIAEAFLKG